MSRAPYVSLDAHIATQRGGFSCAVHRLGPTKALVSGTPRRAFSWCNKPGATRVTPGPLSPFLVSKITWAERSGILLN